MQCFQLARLQGRIYINRIEGKPDNITIFENLAEAKESAVHSYLDDIKKIRRKIKEMKNLESVQYDQFLDDYVNG